MRYRSDVIRAIIESDVWGPTDLHLIDVGASGGVSCEWNLFLPKLRAVGFDPLIASMDAVRASETRTGVTYETAFVRDTEPWVAPPINDPPVEASSLERSSARAVMDSTGYASQFYNAGQAPATTANSIRLDDYCAPGTIVDFLKVDTDGHDLSVLRSASRLFSEGHVLGVSLEVNLDSATPPRTHFQHADVFLRNAGLALFDLRPHRYTRAALPGQWEYVGLPATTMTGPVGWAEAVYFRDVAYRGTVNRERLWKLVALFELFELPDCAAELLLAHPDMTSPHERTRILDLLVASAGGNGNYTDYMVSFRRDPVHFSPHQPITLSAGNHGP